MIICPLLLHLKMFAFCYDLDMKYLPKKYMCKTLMPSQQSGASGKCPDHMGSDILSRLPHDGQQLVHFPILLGGDGNFRKEA